MRGFAGVVLREVAEAALFMHRHGFSVDSHWLSLLRQFVLARVSEWLAHIAARGCSWVGSIRVRGTIRQLTKNWETGSTGEKLSLRSTEQVSKESPDPSVC